jgi:serine/threonine protein kinase
MVLEYASNGTLNNKIKFDYGKLPKTLVRSYFKDICEAVKYLHENNYMHRDIKVFSFLFSLKTYS